MNENTLVVVCGYAGDSHQIRNALPYYMHHGRMVLILSPDDAPVTHEMIGYRPGYLEYKAIGKRAYIGQTSLDRQLLHLKTMLEFPYSFYLMNDSDSVVLNSKLPDYLYAEPGVLWSNEVSDEMHIRSADYKFPRLAFQPPYFMSRAVLEKIIAVAPSVPTDPQTPFIDWCMMAWSVSAGIPHKNFVEGVSCPSCTPPTLGLMTELVRNHGRYFVHSIKDINVLLQIARARYEFKRTHNLT